MKRIGDEIIDEIIQDSNIRNSIHVVLRGTRRKRTRIGRCILKYEDKFIRSIAIKIKNGTFRVERYQEMLVTDGPKVRRVQAIPMLDRIACHAIMAVVEAHVFKKYIRTTGASIKNRGAHDLMAIILRDLKNDAEGMRYFYSSDYKKFYESVSQDFMMFSLRRMFKGKVLLSIFESFVRMMPTGISIGLRSSQAFGNLMLSLHLDHYVKDRQRWKRYYRYCDDVHAAAKTKEEIWEFRRMMHEKSDYMQLTIKPNERIFPITEGLDALGYVVYPDIVRLRKRNKQNFARKIKKLKSKRRRNELTAAFYGICKHGDCCNLFYQLTGIKMKDFRDLKIKPKYQDCKKRFNGQRVSIQDLNGVTIEILDFEKGIIPNWQADEYKQKVDKAKAKQKQLLEKYNGNIPDDVEYEDPDSIKKPEGRYVVFFNGESGKQKFFTGDKDIWSILDQVAEQGELPFRTTIRKVPGQSNKYQFT
jgi:hypothetical protein